VFIASSQGVLNESQARRFRSTCEHIDKLLAEIERIAEPTTPGRPFAHYVFDITPAQQVAVQSHVLQVRSVLVSFCEQFGIAPEEACIPTLRAVRSTLEFVEIGAEEVRPRHMWGYGAVSEEAAAALEAFALEIRLIIAELKHVLCS
jgi:hypothetical protein